MFKPKFELYKQITPITLTNKQKKQEQSNRWLFVRMREHLHFSSMQNNVFAFVAYVLDWPSSCTRET